jgi:microsomal epoxide hydrolase
MVPVAPGITLHIVDTGAATSRPTLVLIPGWRLTTMIWHEQIEAFSHDRRVIAVDPRSQGDSSKTTENDTPEQRAQDLHALLDGLAVGPVVLVGWSQGVQDVAAYVLQYGTRDLKGIVLVDSTISSGAKGVAASPEVAAQQLRLLSLYAHAPEEATAGMMHAIIHRPLKPREFDAIVADGLKTPPAIGAAMLADDLFGPDRTGATAKIDVPTLVIASAGSRELAGQRAMAAKIAHAEFEVIPDAGHAVFVDQPARFDALLNAFISALSS